MGNCIYCGQPAGLLRNKHRECAEKHDRGWAMMVSAAQAAAIGRSASDGLEATLSSIAQSSLVASHEIKDAFIAGWEKAVEHFLDDGSLEAEEEGQLMSFAKRFRLSHSQLDANGAYTKLVQGAVLRDLMEGKVPNRFKAGGTLPFTFQKSESLIWAFSSVAYLEDKTRREYVGRSNGVSIRIARGVYYRVGAFRGRPVETTERVRVDTGILAVTDKHLYFGGAKKTFRVRLDKIISLTPFSDGVGIQRDAASAKPQLFNTGDGWFIYNLLLNVANISS